MQVVSPSGGGRAEGEGCAGRQIWIHTRLAMALASRLSLVKLYFIHLHNEATPSAWEGD